MRDTQRPRRRVPHALTRVSPIVAMSALSPLVLSGLALCFPSVAFADVVSPAPSCPAGESRGAGVLSGLGFFGHGGPPPCEPAVCSELAPCPASHVCRRDAHCITERTTHELRPSPGHGRILDRDDPASYEDVTRSYDVGACDEGRCPADSRCLVVSTCRSPGEADTSPVADDLRGARAAAAWASGVPYTDPSSTTPHATVEAPIPNAESPRPAPPATPPAPSTATTSATSPVTSAPASSSPPASSGLCTVSPSSTGQHALPPLLALLTVLSTMARRWALPAGGRTRAPRSRT
jgi:hypothetical protein